MKTYTTQSIKLYLTFGILMLAVLPLLASYWLLDEVLENSISLSIKPERQLLLENYRDDLKTLRELDPDNEDAYRTRFLQANDELLVYQQPELLKQVLRDTYLTYYFVLLAVVLLVTLAATIWLNQRVAKAYKQLAKADVEKARKLQELSYFDQWQNIASKLAHEINNPLTPIEMMVSNLPRAYDNNSPEAFRENLLDTQTMVTEEVQKLKDMVQHFSRFSKLPEPNLQRVSLQQYCQSFVRQYQNGWRNVSFDIDDLDYGKDAPVNIDHLLLNQCLINLVNNAVQANKDMAEIRMILSISVNDAAAILRVQNSGKSIPEELRERIFQMYYSSKGSEENMGLGLSIVKKIILDHGGDIACASVNDGAAFDISLPLLTSRGMGLQDENQGTEKSEITQ